MKKLSCVVPAWNEEESLPHLWERLRPVLAQFPDWELIIVNDGSTDGTAAIVEELHQREPRVRLVHFRRNRGKSAVLMAGFAAATGDVVVTLDADLQDEPEEIPKLVGALEEHQVDLVGGWKKDRHDPMVKKLSSKVFNWLASQIAGQRFRDLNCGLKAYRKEVVETLDLYGDLYRFIPILVVTNGWKAMELPVKHHPRQWGVSKYGLRLSGAFDLMSLALIANYRFRPLHFFGRWGLTLVVIGMGILVYLTWLHYQGQAIGDRPLLLFAILLVLSGLQLFFTGLLGELMLHLQSRRR